MYEDLFENLVRMNEAKGHYFHLTQEDFGLEVRFEPRNPATAGSYEPDTPRVCVTNTVEGALVALGHIIEINKPVYVYEAIGDFDVVEAKGVVDAEVTGEKWILSPVVFKRDSMLEPLEELLSFATLQDFENLLPGATWSVPYQTKVRKKLEEELRYTLSPAMAEEKEFDDNIPTVPAPLNFDVARIKGKVGKDNNV